MPTTLSEPVSKMLDVGLAYGPRLVAALLLLLGGLLLSLALRRGAEWLVRRTGVEALAERLGVARLLYAIGVNRGLADLVGLVLWIGGLLGTAAVVAETLGLPGLAEGIAVLIEFLPRVLTAGLVLLGGFLSADLLRRMVQRLAEARDDVDSGGFFGHLAYYSVAAVTVTLSAQQLGLQVELVDTLIEITAAAGLFGLALAFALGSRPVFENLLARHYAERMFRPGDQVQVGDARGTVRAYSPVSVFLETPDGEHVVPCKHLLDQAVNLSRGAAEADPEKS